MTEVTLNILNESPSNTSGYNDYLVERTLSDSSKKYFQMTAQSEDHLKAMFFAIESFKKQGILNAENEEIRWYTEPPHSNKDTKVRLTAYRTTPNGGMVDLHLLNFTKKRRFFLQLLGSKEFPELTVSKSQRDQLVKISTTASNVLSSSQQKERPALTIPQPPAPQTNTVTPKIQSAPDLLKDPPMPTRKPPLAPKVDVPKTANPITQPENPSPPVKQLILTSSIQLPQRHGNLIKMLTHENNNCWANSMTQVLMRMADQFDPIFENFEQKKEKYENYMNDMINILRALLRPSDFPYESFEQAISSTENLAEKKEFLLLARELVKLKAKKGEFISHDSQGDLSAFFNHLEEKINVVATVTLIKDIIGQYRKDAVPNVNLSQQYGQLCQVLEYQYGQMQDPGEALYKIMDYINKFLLAEAPRFKIAQPSKEQLLEQIDLDNSKPLNLNECTAIYLPPSRKLLAPNLENSSESKNMFAGLADFFNKKLHLNDDTIKSLENSSQNSSQVSKPDEASNTLSPEMINQIKEKERAEIIFNGTNHYYVRVKDHDGQIWEIDDTKTENVKVDSFLLGSSGEEEPNKPSVRYVILNSTSENNG